MSNTAPFRSPGSIGIDHPGGDLSFGDFTMSVTGPTQGDTLTWKLDNLFDAAGFLLLFAGAPNPASEYFVQDGDTPESVVTAMTASFVQAGYTAVDNLDGTMDITAGTPGDGVAVLAIAFSDKYPLDGFANPSVLASADQYASRAGSTFTTAGTHGYSLNKGAFVVGIQGTSVSTIDSIGSLLQNFGNVSTGTIADTTSYDAGTDVLTVVPNVSTTGVSILGDSADSALAVLADGSDASSWLGGQPLGSRAYLIIENAGAGDARVNFGGPAVLTALSEMGQLIPAGEVVEIQRPPSSAMNISVAAATRFVVLVGNA